MFGSELMSLLVMGEGICNNFSSLGEKVILFVACVHFQGVDAGKLADFKLETLYLRPGNW